jgi:hypothetical protein
MVFTNQKQIADADVLRRCHTILKGKTSVFSNFRSIAKLVMTSMMAVSNNPEEKLNRALQVYELLKEHFYSSPYLPIAAMMITEQVEPSQYERVSLRARSIYDLMKKEHPFLTSREDSVFAVILALSERTQDEIITEMETCYRFLKEYFSYANAVQSLSHVLTLVEGDSKEKCEKTVELFQKLKAADCKYGTNYELATLGILALLPVEQHELISEIQEVDAYLAKQKGYGILGMGRKQRLMHAGMIVSCEHMGEDSSTVQNMAAVSGTISLIVAQQAAMCAAIAASSAAAAGSASS